MDIGYPQPLRKLLIAEGETEEHHIVSDRATTFHAETVEDIEQAVTLHRHSNRYQMFELQTRGDVDSELDAIDVSDELARRVTSVDLRTTIVDIRNR